MDGKTEKRGKNEPQQKGKTGSSPVGTDAATRQQNEESCQAGTLRHISQTEAQNIPSDPDPDDPVSP